MYCQNSLKVKETSVGLSAKRSRSRHMNMSIWQKLPDDIFLLVVAMLSWDEICWLSCTWKQLWEDLVLHRTFFEEYARARLLNPICALHGQQGNHLKYKMIAGDRVGGQSRPHLLTISESRNVSFQDKEMQLLECPRHRKGLAAGCFVLLRQKYRNWICLNPANGTASHICFQQGKMFSPGFVHIFNDGDSHYQILNGCHKPDRDNQNIPSEEILGGFDQTCYFVFYIYRSRTKCWSELLECNISTTAMFGNPVFYKGVIHSVLSSWNSELVTLNEVHYVDERSRRRRWVPHAVALPTGIMKIPHLFTFQGYLMLAGFLQTQPRSWNTSFFVPNLHIWRLNEESGTWVVVSCIPDNILHDTRDARCWYAPLSFGSRLHICSSAGYVIVQGLTYKICPHPGAHCVVVCHIATAHWQMLHFHSEGEDQSKAENVTFYEPRFDISA